MQGNLTSHKDQNTNTTTATTIGFTYDAGNRATQIADTAGGTITRVYDGLDRLKQEVTPEGTVDYTYDAAGRRAMMTVAGQSAVTYTFDNANRLTQIAQGSDAIGFGYDNANRRTSTTLANGVVMTYAYDDANQLATITYTKGATTTGSLATTDLAAAITSAGYNANNQLTSWGGATNSYDLNGNLTGNGTNTYGWDARDQLASISGGVAASFAYDGTGRRKSKTIAGTQTGFLYDGMNFVQELTGTTPKANLITGGIDEVLLRKETSTTRHPITDALGSVIALTDAAGALSTQYSFEPYGKATASGSANTNSQSFTGREDDGTGLMYYRARYFSGSAGRFLAEDPIGLSSGQINFYQYVQGNPISFGDPEGLRCTYSQSTGHFSCSDDTSGKQYVDCHGYSGIGVDRDNPLSQGIKDKGPLPEGNYKIGGFTRRKGPATRPLSPDPANNMRGRSGFLIHGDNPAVNYSASNGCIILPPSCRSAIQTGENLTVTQ